MVSNFFNEALNELPKILIPPTTPQSHESMDGCKRRARERVGVPGGGLDAFDNYHQQTDPQKAARNTETWHNTPVRSLGLTIVTLHACHVMSVCSRGTACQLESE